MQQVRHSIHDDVEGVVHNARQMTDWRHHVRVHPWASLALAAAAGYLAIPQRKHVVKPDTDKLLELMRDKKLVVQPPSVPKPSLLSQGMSIVSGILIRSAGVYAGQQISKILEQTQSPQQGSSHDPSSAKPR